MAVGERLHARAGAARGRVAHRAAQDARRGGRPLSRAAGRQGAGGGGDRGVAEARRRPRERVRAGRGSGKRNGRAVDLALFHRAPRSRQRPALRGAAGGAVLVQLGVRRVRDLPRLRPRDRRRSRPRDSRRAQDAARRRDQADADARVERVPGRPDALRGEGRHPARRGVVRADGRRARLGRQRFAGLERQVAEPVVRREALLRLPRIESVQDAHPRAAVEIPQLHAVRRVRRRAPENGVTAMAARLERECRRRARAGRPLHAARRRLEPRAARSAAGPDRARPDAAADRAHPALLRRHRAAERAARRRIEAAARRGAHAPEIPVRRRARLPDARPAKPHAVGRRGAADQPDDGARHVAHENPVRARRTEHRAASARSHADRRGDAAAARRGQHAGRRRARSVGDARGRSIDRHGPPARASAAARSCTTARPATSARRTR